MKVVRFLKTFSLLLFVIGLVFVIKTLNGSVKFMMGHYGIEIPISYFFVVVLLFSFLLIFLYKIWKFLWAIPEKYQLYLKKKRLAKAQNLILESFSSLAALQYEEAQNAAHLAGHLDPGNLIIPFLEAQSAKALGDFEKSNSFYQKMLKESRLMFLGLYGLILGFKSKKDFLKVDELLTLAIKNRHDSPWVLNELLENDLRLINEGYKGCGEKGPIYKLLSSEHYSKHLSLQYFILAQRQQKLHDLEGARESLRKALSENPKFLGAAIELINISQNKIPDNKFFKMLLKTAKLSPHPDVLMALLKFADYESPTVAYQFVSEQLPHNSYEVLLFLSQLAYKAHLFEIAKHYIDQAIALLPTERTKTHLLKVLKAMNGDLTSHHHPVIVEDYRWICFECYKAHDHFHVICPSCDAANQIEYTNFSVKDIKKQETVPFLLTGS
ncbi:MAG: hypothetical protein KBD31_05250 [Proteobacteria bacterium]|nr:hypothetical protein [Pseudomonadota bacterium]